MGKIMKKTAITRKPMIAIRSEQDGGSAAATRARPVAASGWRFNQYGSFCCRFAAGTAIGNNRFNSWL
jgi:hypothetical protein